MLKNIVAHKGLNLALKMSTMSWLSAVGFTYLLHHLAPVLNTPALTVFFLFILFSTTAMTVSYLVNKQDKGKSHGSSGTRL